MEMNILKMFAGKFQNFKQLLSQFILSESINEFDRKKTHMECKTQGQKFCVT